MDVELKQLIADFLAYSEQREEEVWSQSDYTDLTFKQLGYIQVIGRVGNPTLSELAEVLEVSRPTASVSIDRLQQKGYVKRVQSDTDRRSAHIHLSERGLRAYNLHQEVHNGIAGRLIAYIEPAERSLLTSVLKRFLCESK